MKNTTKREGDWCQTYTGVHFYPLDPRQEDINIQDISHALSMQCRFNGHCSKFYSVAEHCVYVYKELKRRFPLDYNLQLWGLLHDLAEAYLPDIPRPIKKMDIGVLRDCEKNIMRVACSRYGITTEEPKEVKIVDTALLATEAGELMTEKVNDCHQWYLPEEPLDIKINCWNPEEAEKNFISAFNYITLAFYLQS